MMFVVMNGSRNNCGNWVEQEIPKKSQERQYSNNAFIKLEFEIHALR